VKTIKVKSTDETKVGIWEVNEDHPDGDAVVEVAKTSSVNKALARGLIVEVVETKPARKKPASS